MPRIAAQLFTLREFTETESEFRSTLVKLTKIGYREVQLSAVGCMDGSSPEVDATSARAMLDEAGIAAPLTHRPWEEIRFRTDDCIAFHKTVGAELVGLGSIPAEFRVEGLDGYRRFVDEIEPVIAQLKSAGLRFGYHNHSFEFEKIGPEGETPYSVMMERGSHDLHFILDTCWVAHAGIDLCHLIGRLRWRIPMVHLKDMVPVGDEIRMAPVGEGNLNWNEILPELSNAGTQVFAVEQDNCYGRDPFDCLASSYRFLAQAM